MVAQALLGPGSLENTEYTFLLHGVGRHHSVATVRREVEHHAQQCVGPLCDVQMARYGEDTVLVTVTGKEPQRLARELHLTTYRDGTLTTTPYSPPASMTPATSSATPPLPHIPSRPQSPPPAPPAKEPLQPTVAEAVPAVPPPAVSRSPTPVEVHTNMPAPSTPPRSPMPRLRTPTPRVRTPTPTSTPTPTPTPSRVSWHPRDTYEEERHDRLSAPSSVTMGVSPSPSPSPAVTSWPRLPRAADDHKEGGVRPAPSRALAWTRKPTTGSRLRVRNRTVKMPPNKEKKKKKKNKKQQAAGDGKVKAANKASKPPTTPKGKPNDKSNGKGKATRRGTRGKKDAKAQPTTHSEGSTGVPAKPSVGASSPPPSPLPLRQIAISALGDGVTKAEVAAWLRRGGLRAQNIRMLEEEVVVDCYAPGEPDGDVAPALGRLGDILFGGYLRPVVREVTRRRRGAPVPRPSRTLYVTGFADYKAVNFRLKAKFGGFGAVEGVYVNENRQGRAFALVAFERVAAAEEALRAVEAGKVKLGRWRLRASFGRA